MCFVTSYLRQVGVPSGMLSCIVGARKLLAQPLERLAGVFEKPISAVRGTARFPSPRFTLREELPEQVVQEICERLIRIEYADKGAQQVTEQVAWTFDRSDVQVYGREVDDEAE